MERFVLEEFNVKCEIDKKKQGGQLRIETEQNDTRVWKEGRPKRNIVLRWDGDVNHLG